MKQTAFERYTPYIQEYIYKKRWQDLKEVQVEACEKILDTPDNVIIASTTASGKTEAAFFPILTDLENNPTDSIGILYISPLKALINDQFERLNDLLTEQRIPVIPWHGDIPTATKKKANEAKQGIIQITPESLEALIMRNPERVRTLFKDLRYIVIDEMHEFMHSDRGLQVIALINRLERLIKRHVRRIGLSATLSNYGSAIDFISAGSPRPTSIVGLSQNRRQFQVGIESFVLNKDYYQEEEKLNEYFRYLYDLSIKQKSLIFTNSRNETERTISNLRLIAQEKHEPDIFYAHHGSLSTTIRKETEESLKNSLGATVTAATLTLELGIDIGDLDRIIQIGAPFSSSSFVQRLGRSGRKSGRSQIFFLDLYRRNAHNPLADFPWTLLRAIAIIELYLKYKWVEPIETKPKPFSLLAHQTLSTLYAFNGLKPAELARWVLTLPPFSEITKTEYQQLLRNMIKKEFLEIMDSGEIIIGYKAENLVNHYSFYSVFETRETFEVISQEGPIGMLDECPPLQSVFVLAGRSWKVTSVNEESKKVFVIPFKGKRLPDRHGEFGIVHPRIMEQIKEILSSDTEYSFLQGTAQELLKEAREKARSLEILDKTFIPTGKHSLIIAPWTGTQEIDTLYRLLDNGLREKLKISYVNNYQYFIEVVTLKTAEEFIKAFKKLKIDLKNPDLFLEEDEIPQIDKYDFMVPDNLLKEAFLKNHIKSEPILTLIEGTDPIKDNLPEFIAIEQD